MTHFLKYLKPQTISSKITMEQKRLENMKYFDYLRSLVQMMQGGYVK